MGENGAGKSTLIKAITGALPLTEGELRLDGVAGALRVTARRPASGDQHGLPGDRPAAEHLRRREHRARPRAAPVRADRLGADARATRTPCSPISGSTSIPPRSWARTRSPCSSSSPSRGRSPPTSGCSCSTSRPRAWTSTSAPSCSASSATSSERGVAILFVSHFLDQVYEICDRVTVLRDGKLVGEYLTRELLRIDLVQEMLGRSADSLRTRSLLHVADDRKEPYLSARSVSVGSGINEADVDLVEGEVLGVAGLLGSGRTELARALSGIDKLDAGIIRIQGSDESLARAAVGDLARRRLLLGEPAHRGHHQRAERAGEHHPRPAGRARHPAPDPAVAPARARAELDRGARHPAARPGPAGRHAVRRQPAEGAAGAAAGPLPARARARRADPGHRRRARRSRCRTWSASSPTTASRSCSSRPSSRRCCGSANRVAIVQDGRIVDTLPSEELTVDSLMAMVAQPGRRSTERARRERGRPSAAAPRTSSTWPASPASRTRPSRGSSTTCRTSGPRPARGWSRRSPSCSTARPPPPARSSPGVPARSGWSRPASPTTGRPRSRCTSTSRRGRAATTSRR